MLPGFTRPEPARNSPGFYLTNAKIIIQINIITAPGTRPVYPARNPPGTRPVSIWRFPILTLVLALMGVAGAMLHLFKETGKKH